MKQGLIYAMLGLNSDAFASTAHPSAGIWGLCHHTWTITNSNFSHGIDEDIETHGRGGLTMSDEVCRQEGTNLSPGLQRSDLENPVWFTGILALEYQQAREKVISGCLTVSSRIADAEPSSLKYLKMSGSVFS